MAQVLTAGAAMSDSLINIIFLTLIALTVAVIITNRVRTRFKSQRVQSFVKILSFFLGLIYTLLFLYGLIFYITHLNKLDA